MCNMLTSNSIVHSVTDDGLPSFFNISSINHSYIACDQLYVEIFGISSNKYWMNQVILFLVLVNSNVVHM